MKFGDILFFKKGRLLILEIYYAAPVAKVLWVRLRLPHSIYMSEKVTARNVVQYVVRYVVRNVVRNVVQDCQRCPGRCPDGKRRPPSLDNVTLSNGQVYIGQVFP